MITLFFLVFFVGVLILIGGLAVGVADLISGVRLHKLLGAVSAGFGLALVLIGLFGAMALKEDRTLEVFVSAARDDGADQLLLQVGELPVARQGEGDFHDLAGVGGSGAISRAEMMALMRETELPVGTQENCRETGSGQTAVRACTSPSKDGPQLRITLHEG